MKKSMQGYLELEAALEAAAPTLDNTKGATVEINDTDYLEVEIVQMPVTGLSINYLYRFGLY